MADAQQQEAETQQPCTVGKAEDKKHSHYRQAGEEREPKALREEVVHRKAGEGEHGHFPECVVLDLELPPDDSSGPELPMDRAKTPKAIEVKHSPDDADRARSHPPPLPCHTKQPNPAH